MKTSPFGTVPACRERAQRNRSDSTFGTLQTGSVPFTRLLKCLTTDSVTPDPIGQPKEHQTTESPISQGTSALLRPARYHGKKLLSHTLVLGLDSSEAPYSYANRSRYRSWVGFPLAPSGTKSTISQPRVRCRRT